MPTTKQRLQVTETDAVKHALEVAARRWPEVTSRSALLAALAEMAAERLEGDEERRREERRELVEKYAGGFHYPPGYLEELRRDWPE
ncbi:hypothetical protein [Nocardioides acrostichi]|uniref:Uncharacterized protein n=1 Tax=Nocardioides acrostichi TaxID=2784339 RepID=A0A930UVS2_9ACTN|nr:hypothetical protein [Nocardioides acrostichi]MBF4161763.1 hypothetical protein [Nocardioides acrostichi]